MFCVSLLFSLFRLVLLNETNQLSSRLREICSRNHHCMIGKYHKQIQPDKLGSHFDFLYNHDNQKLLNNLNKYHRGLEKSKKMMMSRKNFMTEKPCWHTLAASQNCSFEQVVKQDENSWQVLAPPWTVSLQTSSDRQSKVEEQYTVSQNFHY